MTSVARRNWARPIQESPMELKCELNGDSSGRKITLLVLMASLGTSNEVGMIFNKQFTK